MTIYYILQMYTIYKSETQKTKSKHCNTHTSVSTFLRSSKYPQLIKIRTINKACAVPSLNIKLHTNNSELLFVTFFNFAIYEHCIKYSVRLPPHQLPMFQISEQFLPTDPWVKVRILKSSWQYKERLQMKWEILNIYNQKQCASALVGPSNMEQCVLRLRMEERPPI